MRIRINLLPHREIRRALRQRQFVALAGLTTALGVLTVLLVHGMIGGRLDDQSARNQYLQAEVANLDKQIVEINRIKEQTQAMLAKKQVVESLQTNRSEAVHLLDQLQRHMPEGVYLKSVKQTMTVVNLTGYAQSNARVSTLIRNLAGSPWLENPELVEIKAVTVNNTKANEFSLNVKIKRTDDHPKPKDRQRA